MVFYLNVIYAQRKRVRGGKNKTDGFIAGLCPAVCPLEPKERLRAVENGFRLEVNSKRHRFLMTRQTRVRVHLARAKRVPPRCPYDNYVREPLTNFNVKDGKT